MKKNQRFIFGFVAGVLGGSLVWIIALYGGMQALDALKSCENKQDECSCEAQDRHAPTAKPSKASVVDPVKASLSAPTVKKISVED